MFDIIGDNFEFVNLCDLLVSEVSYKGTDCTAAEILSSGGIDPINSHSIILELFGRPTQATIDCLTELRESLNKKGIDVNQSLESIKFKLDKLDEVI